MHLASLPKATCSLAAALKSATVVIFTPWESANARNEGYSPPPESGLSTIDKHHTTGPASSCPAAEPVLPALWEWGFVHPRLLTPTVRGGAACVRGELVPRPVPRNTVDCRELHREKEFGVNLVYQESLVYRALCGSFVSPEPWATESPTRNSICRA